MTNKPAGNGFFNRPGKGLIQVTNSLSGTYVGGFISGIKMYTYADEHTPEGKMVLPAYFQRLQAVVIQHPVIYPLTGSAFAVDIFVLLGIPGYAGLKAQTAKLGDFYYNNRKAH